MKKIWTLLFCLSLATTGFALPVGNPVDPSLLQGRISRGGSVNCDPCFNWCDAWSARVGFYGDYVFQRHLRVDKSSNESTVRKTRLNTNGGLIAVDFCNMIELFAVLGSSHLDLQIPPSAFGPAPLGNDPIYYRLETSFSYSVGARAVLWECGCFGLGVEGQYFYTNPEIKSLREEILSPRYNTIGARARYQEWQVGGGVSYQYCACAFSLVPYLGVKWSGVKMDNGDFFFNGLSRWLT